MFVWVKEGSIGVSLIDTVLIGKQWNEEPHLLRHDILLENQTDLETWLAKVSPVNLEPTPSIPPDKDII